MQRGATPPEPFAIMPGAAFARAAALAGLLGSAALAGPAAAQEQLVLNAYGAEYEPIIRERIIEPFEKEFGVKVVYDVNGSASEDYARIRATQGAPGFDVVVMTASESLVGCQEGLLAPINAETVPNVAFLSERVQSQAGGCGAIHEVQYMSLLYRTDYFSEPPKSWKLLGDPALKDKIILPNFANILGVYLTQVFSVMGGGDVNSMDPGMAYLKEIAPQTIEFVQSSSIMSKYIEDGTAVAMPFWNARAGLLKQQGLPVDFVIPEEGTIPLLPTLNIPVNAEHKDLAYKFVNFWLNKKQQEDWAQGYLVGTIRTDVDLPADFRANQITTQADIDKLLLPDLTLLGEKRSDWNARWMREISRLAQE